MPKDDKENKPKVDYDNTVARRRVRATYRELASNIEENALEVTNPESTKLSEYLEKAEELFSKVRHPREAIHDSNFLVQLTKKGREQAQQLKTDMVSFDNITFAEKIIGYVNGRHNINAEQEDDDAFVDLSKQCWEKLAKRTCPLFKKTYLFDFLLGPLVIEVAAPRQIHRNAQNRIPEGKVVKLKQIENVEEQEEATTKEVERIYHVLKDKTDHGKNNICFFSFIINPESFGQTVENLFHLSFLVKDDRVSVELDDNELPTLNIHTGFTEKDQNDQILRKQVVCPLTMTDWKQLIDCYNITESTIPTRSKIYNKKK